MAIKKTKNGTEIRQVVTYERLFSMMKLMLFWVAHCNDPENTCKNLGILRQPYLQQIPTAL